MWAAEEGVSATAKQVQYAELILTKHVGCRRECLARYKTNAMYWANLHKHLSVVFVQLSSTVLSQQVQPYRN